MNLVSITCNNFVTLTLNYLESEKAYCKRYCSNFKNCADIFTKYNNEMKDEKVDGERVIRLQRTLHCSEKKKFGIISLPQFSGMLPKTHIDVNSQT